jgi:hypothetical protein
MAVFNGKRYLFWTQPCSVNVHAFKDIQADSNWHSATSQYDNPNNPKILSGPSCPLWFALADSQIGVGA